MWGDHEELKIFLSNCLIPSRLNQELRNKEGIHRFLKGDFRTSFGPFDPVGRWFRWPRLHNDRGPSVGEIVAPDFMMNKPRSRDDRAMIAR